MSEKNLVEQYMRRFLFLSNVPFIKVPLVCVGLVALALKTAETSRDEIREKKSRAALVVPVDNGWAVDD